MQPGQRIAYVVSGFLTREQLEHVGDLSEPNSEFYLASRRPDVDFYSLDHAQSRHPRLFRLVKKRGVRHLIYAADLAALATSYTAIITSGEDVGLPLLMMLAARRIRLPVVVPVHGYYFHKRLFRMQFSACRRDANAHFACLSSSLRERLIEEFGGDPARCHATGYGVDIDFFSPAVASSPACDGELPLVASAGVSNRDYDTLIAATRDLPVRVRIAAASNWVSDRPTSAREGNVEIGSAGSYVNLRSLYASAAVVVVPLTDEDFATGYAVIAEAMAMGRPIVATRTRAPSDFIHDGRDGILAPPGDSRFLRTCLETLLGDEDRRNSLGREAQVTMQAFSVEGYLAKLVSLAGVVEPGRRGADQGRSI